MNVSRGRGAGAFTESIMPGIPQVAARSLNRLIVIFVVGIKSVFATVAQLAVQLICNQPVAGSIPAGGPDSVV